MKTLYYTIDLNDESGLIRTSLVSDPAIGKTFEKFDNLIELKFDIEEDKRIVTGPVMIPDLKMLRKYSDSADYYYGVFSKDTIDIIVKKASIENKFNNINLRHSQKEADMVNCAVLIESYFLTDELKPEKYSDLPNGTWIASYWISDKTYWNEVIKNEEFKGFSIEVLAYKSEENDQELFEKYKLIETILNSNISDNEKNTLIKTILQ